MIIPVKEVPSVEPRRIILTIAGQPNVFLGGGINHALLILLPIGPDDGMHNHTVQPGKLYKN
jgi:hypothetical protein